MIMQRNNATGTSSLGSRDQVYTETHDIVEVNNLNTVCGDHSREPPCGGWPIEIEVRVQRAHGKPVNRQPLIQIEDKRSGWGIFRRLSSCEYHNRMPTAG